MGLDLSIAAALARRGFETVAGAREFIEADDRHPPAAFAGMDRAVETVLGAVRDATPITIYGDYDADGVSATAILVGLLRELGATCDWFIPDRISEGYGLNADAVRSIAGRGTGLVITVDCGIASPEEVELGKELGMEMVVTDHHQFGERLPDCALLHPVVSGYPFEWLCGAAVAAKLATAIRERAGGDPAGDEADLDLVALATVADVMPLVGENRRLVREGLKVARRGARPGMRALMTEAGVEPSALESGDLGFKLGPRVNAVGRMYRADAGVELFLTTDPERAAEIGEELSKANAERRRVQQEVEREAREMIAGMEDEDRSVVVVAGEGWHPGVVGIVASHIARQEGMPAVVIALDDGVGKGSARSVPGVDLHAAISTQAGLLDAFGGHAAAAGLSLDAARLEEFRRGLDRAVRGQTGGERAPSDVAVDGFVGGEGLGARLAGEIESLGPYGTGNPQFSLLVPSAGIEDVSPMGEGKHIRFTISSGGYRAKAVWFGRPTLKTGEETRFDVLGELSLNHWNGSVEPQFKVLDVTEAPRGEVEPLRGAEPEEWWQRFEVALSGEDPPPAEARAVDGWTLEHRTSSEAVVAELVSSGESVLVLTAEGTRRWQGIGGAAGLGRFAPEESAVPLGTWAGSPVELLAGAGPPVCLSDYDALVLEPDLPSRFENVVLFDPPASQADQDRASTTDGLVHLPFDRGAFAFARAASRERHDPLPSLRVIYVELRDGGERSGEDLRNLLVGDPRKARSPEAAATLVRIMLEAEIGLSSGTGDARVLGAVSSGEVDLERSGELRRQEAIHQEEVAFLEQQERLRSRPNG